MRNGGSISLRETLAPAGLEGRFAVLNRGLLVVAVLLSQVTQSSGEDLVCRRCGCMQPPKITTRVECRSTQHVTWCHNLEAAPACLAGPSCPCGTVPQCDPVTKTVCQVPKWFPSLGKPVTVVQLVRTPKVVTKPFYVSVTECTCAKCGLVGITCTPLPDGERWRLYPDPVTDRRELMAAQLAATPSGVPSAAPPQPQPYALPPQNLSAPTLAPPNGPLPPGSSVPNDVSSPPPLYRSTP